MSFIETLDVFSPFLDILLAFGSRTDDVGDDFQGYNHAVRSQTVGEEKSIIEGNTHNLVIFATYLLIFGKRRASISGFQNEMAERTDSHGRSDIARSTISTSHSRETTCGSLYSHRRHTTRKSNEYSECHPAMATPSTL